MVMYSPGSTLVNDLLISRTQVQSLSHSVVTPDSYTEW